MKAFLEKIRHSFSYPKGETPSSNSSGFREFTGWAYRKLSSIRTSIYILLGMALFYLLGTVFPQGANIDDYVQAGGRFVFAVRLFNLLDVFSGIPFLFLAFLLFLNIAICTYERFFHLLVQKMPVPRDFTPTATIPLTMDAHVAQGEIWNILRERLNFRLLSKGQEWTVMERGLSYRWLTWLYHAGIVVCFMGFLITYLFAVEDVVTLYPGKPVEITPSSPGRLEGLWRDRHPKPGFSIILDEFITEYVQHPSIDYPRDRVSRLAIALGWRDVTYTINEKSFFPKDWKSRLRILKNGLTVYEKTIEVNDPLVYEGYTFYQMAFEQRLRIGVDNNPILLEVKTGDELIVPGLTTPLRFTNLITGTLYRLDGGTEGITPFVTVKRTVKDEGGGKRTEKLGILELGGSITVDGKKITLADIEEASILSYRYDPGVGILWWTGLFVFLVITIRCFGGWYMLAYRIEESDGIAYLTLSIQTRGLIADRTKMTERLVYYITSSELKPTPLPPSS